MMSTIFNFIYIVEPNLLKSLYFRYNSDEKKEILEFFCVQNKSMHVA